MKAASIIELKQELSELPAKTIMELCLRLARYKKENKELLTYLLFESQDEQGFVNAVRKEMDEQFAVLPNANWYLTKKGLRRILRIMSRHAKHSGIVESELDMLIHFCNCCKSAGLSGSKYKAILNIYERQLEKLNGLVKKVHEDLQFDYRRQIALLQP
jgi:hypothetical protein